MEPGEVTPGWIRRHLGWEVAERGPLSIERIGEGRGLLGRLFRVRCLRSGEADSFVLKLSPAPGSTWDDYLASMAPFPREAQAYRLFEGHRDRLRPVLPECYWSWFADDGTGAVALEDLERRGATTVDYATGLSREQLVGALRSLALLHATFASAGRDGEVPVPPHPWLYGARSPELAAVLREAMRRASEIAAERFPDRFPSEALVRLREWPVEADMLSSHRGSRLVALCHGDLWSSNVVFTPGRDGDAPGAVLLDWQFPTWGNPLIDVAFLLLSSAEAHRWRGARVEELLAEYHGALLASAPEQLDYSLDSCRADFRRALAYGTLMSLANLEAVMTGLDGRPAARVGERLAIVLEESRRRRGPSPVRGASGGPP